MIRSSIVLGPRRSFERDHPFNTYTNFFEKLTFLPPGMYTYLFISVYEHISYHALNTSDISHKKYFIIYFFRNVPGFRFQCCLGFKTPLIPMDSFQEFFSNFTFSSTLLLCFYMVNFMVELTAVNKWFPLLNISVNENFLKL